MKANSIDSLVTDPPAGIGFMSLAWDESRGGREHWVAWLTKILRECLRVLKPGAYALVWSLPRTEHWTAWAVEDAGFEIRDGIYHIHAQGWPQSSGASLKPAVERWVLARKPLEGSLLDNVKKYGTGKLSIESCGVSISSNGGGANGETLRLPTNGLLSHAEECAASCVEGCPVKALNDQAGPRKSGDYRAVNRRSRRGSTYGKDSASTASLRGASDGDASRFFPTFPAFGYFGKARFAAQRGGADNNHPTAKGLDLMRWLVRLVTPVGGMALDPFMGSGSTGEAALLEGRGFCGCDVSKDYFKIAERRLGRFFVRGQHEIL